MRAEGRVHLAARLLAFFRVSEQSDQKRSCFVYLEAIEIYRPYVHSPAYPSACCKIRGLILEFPRTAYSNFERSGTFPMSPPDIGNLRRLLVGPESSQLMPP